MKDLKKKLYAWLVGDYDLDAPEDIPEPGKKGEPEPTHRNIVIHGIRHPRLIHAIYSTLAVFCLVCLCTLLLLTISNMPRYGESQSHMDMLTEEYIEHGMENTGAVNIVAGIILEYRAFDTLGESFVLFCALNCVLALLQADSKREEEKLKNTVSDLDDLSMDPVLRQTAKIIIPFIFMYGVYILLNGHLSPGGGFSGGAVLGAAIVLFSAAYGEEAARRFLSERRFKIVSLIALSFYCLSKSYSFYTGANELESFIGNGTPGDIISAGLILPLNIAVGLVVACTIYGIYRMLGWRRF